MARVWKRLKKYERWVLIAVTILLLATFSITGVSARGCGRGAGQPEDLGGSYEPVPGRRETVSDDEVRRATMRYAPIYQSEMWGPSLLYGSEMSGTPRGRRLSPTTATWIHLVGVGTAEAAGYLVGDEELRAGIEEMVVRGIARRPGMDPRSQELRFSPELYDQIIEHLYRLPKSDFEETVRGLLAKDKLLSDIVDTQRFSRSPQEAFDAWKPARERVDLAFAAVPAAQFADVVGKEEETRSAIAKEVDLLGKMAVAAIDVRRVQEAVKQWKAANGGVLPKDAAELLSKEPGAKALRGKVPVDPWGKDVVYEAAGEAGKVYSVGPDGAAGTADDVGPDVLDQLDALAALRRTADALVAWQRTAGSWPAALADLTQAPKPSEPGKPAPPAPLSVVPKDPWGHDLVYAAAGPSLSSAGPDGQPGTADDLVAQVTAGSARVPLPSRLEAWRPAEAKDAWGRPLAVQLTNGNPILFSASSAGADGVAGTDDDVVDGNDADLRTFYTGRRYEFRVPMKREIEALYVIPALVPDAVFAEAWKRFPEWRPEEKDAWDFFRSTATYHTTTGEGAEAKEVDAADPEKGFASALLADLREKGAIPKDAKGWPVPAADDFGDRKDVPAAAPGGLPSPAADPLFKTYVEKGWRRVVLRDQFFGRMFSAALKAAREAADAHKAWEKGGKKGAEPALAPLTGLLAKVADLKPSEQDAARGGRFLQFFATKPGEPLSREELEKLPDLGDLALSSALSSLKDGDYQPVPTLLRDGGLHVALHCVKRHAERDPDLAEVRDKVWPRYLESRTLERAARELERVSDAAAKAFATGGPDGKTPLAPEARLAEVERLLKEASEQRKFTYTTGRTGPFVGSARGGRHRGAAEGGSEEDRRAAARKAYVRRTGYDEVRALGTSAASPALETGTLGRRVLRDTEGGTEGTGSAYLVQLAWRQDPDPAEFGGRQYLRWLEEQAYDQPEWSPADERLTNRKGFMIEVLARCYDDFDRIRRAYGIQTAKPLEAAPPDVAR